MAEYIVGIDIGESLIKAVCIEKSFRQGIRIIDAAVINIIEEAGGMDGALKRLFSNQNFLEGRCAVNFPGRDLSFRRLRLPFGNRKKIDQIITFEIEPLIPYQIENVVIDYEITPGNGYSDIMAVIAIRSSIEELIALLDAHGRTVEVIDADLFSVHSKLFKKETNENIFLLDVGDRSTMAIFSHAGRVIQARHFAIGKKNLMGNAAPVCVDSGEAGVPETSGNKVTGDKTKLSEDWKILLEELKKTGDFLTWHGHLSGGVKKIFLTGGGSLIEETQKILSEHFALPVTVADISPLIPAVMDEGLKKTWSPALMNQALALAAGLARTEVGFNFKPLVMVRKNIFTGLKNNIKKIAAIAIIFLTLLGAEFYLDYALQSVMASRLKDEANTIFLRSVPDTTRIVDAVQQMKNRIAEAKKATSGIKEAISGVTVLEMMRDISSMSPQATGFAIASFSYDGSQIIIKGDALNFDAVDTIKRELSSSKHFSNITIASSNIRKQDNKVEFEMRIGIRKQT